MNKIYINDKNETVFVKSDEPIFDSNGQKVIPFEVKKDDAITLSEVASKIASVNLKDVVFFINVNLKFKDHKRQEQTGIELLIWLRLKGAMNHCILHSFETTHALLNRRPENLIATSKGTSFVQMPEILKEVKTDDLEKDIADKKNLKIFLKAAFKNDEVKHRLANIYGLWFLFNTHNHFFSDEKIENTIFQKEFFLSFNSFQLEIAQYLIKGNSNSSSTNILHNKISVIKGRIKDRNPNFLYIDDKADLGWETLIRAMLSDKVFNPNLISVIPNVSDFSSDDNFKKLVDSVSSKIYNNGNYTDCVFLDLRLADEEGEILEVEKLSGIRLLNAIHKAFPALPVIITTASNKAESVKNILQLGAETLWTKPGLDNLHDEQGYLSAYLELLNHTEQALSKYSTTTEKHIVKAQFELSQLWGFKFIPNQIKDIDVVLTDTNVWCETGANLVKNHKVLFLLSSILKKVRKRFILIDDVLNELFIHTQNRKEIALRKSASFSLGLIQQYKNDYMMESSFDDVKDAIKETTNYNLQSSKGGGFHIVSNATKIHSFHKTKEAAEAELEQRREDAYKPLHADDTFKLLVSHLLHQGKIVLFVSNDRKCKIEILNTVKYKNEEVNQNWEIPASFDVNKGILKVASKNNSFCMLISTDVLYEICFPKKGNTIPTLELPFPNSP